MGDVSMKISGFIWKCRDFIKQVWAVSTATWVWIWNSDEDQIRNEGCCVTWLWARLLLVTIKCNAITTGRNTRINKFYWSFSVSVVCLYFQFIEGRVKVYVDGLQKWMNYLWMGILTCFTAFSFYSSPVTTLNSWNFTLKISGPLIYN